MPAPRPAVSQVVDSGQHVRFKPEQQSSLKYLHSSGDEARCAGCSSMQMHDMRP